MLKKLRKDYARLEGGVARKIMNIGLWILLLYRISNFFYYNRLFLISKIVWMFNRLLFTVDIDPGAKLAGGVKLVHPMCIVIGREVESEGYLTIYQGTTLGGSNNREYNYKGKTIKQPYILNNVVIYTSSVIIGPLVLGENSTVAANATLSKNLPENSIAFGFNQIKNKH